MNFYSSGPASLVQAVLVLFVLLVVGSAQAQDILFVAVNGTGTSCSSLENACKSIQAAVALAPVGATIRIGPGTYVENLQITTAGVSLVSMVDPASPDGSAVTVTAPVIVESAGGTSNTAQEVSSKLASVDVVVEIGAPNVTLMGLVIRHPEGTASQLDVGILVRPTANHTLLDTLIVERLRIAYDLDNTVPGSRGLLVTKATHLTCRNSIFRGSYQDHISLSTSLAFIEQNIVANATRIGIVIYQDLDDQGENLSVYNVIKENTVVGSASDGIQVQGNNNTIQDNTVSMNRGYGIHFCGSLSNPPCVSPGETAIARFNTAGGNFFWDNGLGGEYVQDQGDDNYSGQAHDTSTPEVDTTEAPTDAGSSSSATTLPPILANVTKQEGTQEGGTESSTSSSSSTSMAGMSSDAAPLLGKGWGLFVSLLIMTASWLSFISFC